MKIKPVVIYFVTLAFANLVFNTTLRAQSNIVYNGSFEIGVVAGWEYTLSSVTINEHGAADGKNWVNSGSVAQNLTTVAGRTYQIRFAMFNSTVNVKWNDAVVGTASAPYLGWTYTNFYVSATGSVSRIVIDSTGSLDDISVGWTEEPPSIVRAVPSRSAFEGGTVTFPVLICGAPDIHYQWYFEQNPVPGATNDTLVLTNVQKALQGDYVVAVSNAFGTVRSLPASLIVSSIPDVPTIIHQPKNIQMTAGYNGGFNVFAVSRDPLFYQWRFNGTNMGGATNSHLSISPIGTNDAGSYSVLVSNHFGSELSLPASLTVQTGLEGGYVEWDNYVLDYDARVFDTDGVTPLEGPNYVAQLYAGADSNNLHAASVPVPFLTGSDAGLYFGSDSSTTTKIPDVLAYQTAYIQVRVWEKSRWATFEEATALGGKVGKSDVIAKMVMPPWSIPALPELYSFKLEAGSPILATAKLYPNPESTGKDREWLLVGEIGARYTVESRTPPNDWNPIMQVTNITGTVTFIDTNAQNASLKFYRAQIIDQ